MLPDALCVTAHRGCLASWTERERQTGQPSERTPSRRSMTSMTMSMTTPTMTWAGPPQMVWLTLKVTICLVTPEACILLRLDRVACMYLRPVWHA